LTQPPLNEPPSLSAEEIRVQRILKLVVIGLGLLIVGVLGMMIYTVVSGGRSGQDVSAADGVTADGKNAAATPYSHDIAIPRHAMVIESRVDGSTLMLRLTLPEGGEEIMMIDMPTGKVVGRMRMLPSD